MEGAAAASRGDYAPGAGWRVVPSLGAGSSERMLVSLHEAAHAEFNDSTAFGTALHIYAWLAHYATKASHDYDHFFDWLIGCCLNTHEQFATYLSVNMVAEASPPESLLAGYPMYADWYGNAHRLCPLPGRRIPYLGVKASLRVCMQTTILSRILGEGAEGFAAGGLLRAEMPDARLATLRTALDSQFWQRVVGDWEVVDGARWREMVAMDADPDRRFELAEPTWDEPQNAFEHHVFEAVASVLRSAGGETLPYDGHHALTSSVIAGASGLASPSAYRLYAAQDRPQPEVETALTRFEDEHLVVAPEKLDGEMFALSQFGDDELSELATLEGTSSGHFFVIARRASRMLEQYRLEEQEAAWLGALGDETIVCIRRRVILPDGTARVQLWVVEDPREIGRLMATAVRPLGVIASVSMASLGEGDWAEAWLPPLLANGRASALFDLSPARHLRLWATEGRPVAFAVLRLSDDADGGTHVLVCEHAEQPLPFLTPCSEVVAKSAVLFIQECIARPDVIFEDVGLVERHRMLLQLTVGHLMREERMFDFDAGRGPGEGVR
jgi:hypothetical protein